MGAEVDVAVVVLAGGTSRRFGSDKLDAVVDGVPLLDAAIAALPQECDVVLVGPPRPTVRAGTWVREEPAGGGPAAGMVTGLRHALERGAELVAVLPADAPGAGAAAVELLQRLAADPAAQALVGLDDEGREQPLQLALRRSAAEQLVAAAGGGQGASARALVAALVPPASRVRLRPESAYDIDTPDQLMAWNARHSAAVSAVLELVARRRRPGGPPVVLAVDGRSGTGKSTLATAVRLRTGATVLPGDDFLSVALASTAAGDLDRLCDAEVAGSVFDWERLRTEALEPLAAGRVARYRAFDWSSLGPAARLGPSRQLQPAPLVVLEGVYAARPELSDLVSASVLMTVDEAARSARLARRGDDPVWAALWQRGERHYFRHVLTPADADLVVAPEIGKANGP